MSRISPIPEYVSVMSFNRPLAIPVANHAFIKAAISMTADEIFPNTELDNTIELRGVPLEEMFLPEKVQAKIGPYWRSMDIVMPHKLPGGILDVLPEGTRIRLQGNRRGDKLEIDRSDGDLPIYTVSAHTKRYAGPTEPYPDLTQNEVISLMISGLGMDGSGRDIDNLKEAREVFRDLSLTYPNCERICADRQQVHWDVGGIAARATLTRIHSDSFRWRQPKKQFAFSTVTDIPLILPGTGGISHSCIASEGLRYKFDKLYSRSEKDIEADLEVKFESTLPPDDMTRRHYARLVRETGPQKQEMLAQSIVNALGNLVMAHRDSF